MDYSFLVALSIGLLSTLHCVGMCSGIIGALSFSLPQQIQREKKRALPFVLAYNLGRIASYTAAGAIVGYFATEVFSTVSPTFGHDILRTISTVTLLVIGLHLAGWFPKLIQLERLGKPIWKRIEPYGRRLLPVRSPLHAFAFGAIWGWLPCGLVYSTLLWAGAAGNTQTSALLMLGFGLGTLPTVLTASIFTVWMARITRLPHFRRGAGLALIVLSLVSPFYALTPHEHNHNHSGLSVGGDQENASQHQFTNR